MENNLHIRKYVMRRVYMTYVLRQLQSPLALKAYSLLAVFLVLARSVSLGNVIANMPNIFKLSDLYIFFSSAFINTEVVAQIGTIALLAIVTFLVKDMLTKKAEFYPHMGVSA